MNDREFEERLKQEIGKLKRELRPHRDLWPGIDHAIHHSSSFTPGRSFALAASVLLAIALVVSGALYTRAPQQDSQGVADFIAQLQSEHEKNKQNLLVQYQGQQALAPDWEEQMDQLEQAEQAIYRALMDDPENLELLKILRQVQTKQIDLIESVYAPLFTTI